MNVLNYEGLGLHTSNNVNNEGYIIGETSGVDLTVFKSVCKIAEKNLHEQIRILNTYSSSQDKFWTQTFYKKTVTKLIETIFNEIFDTQFPVFMDRISNNVPILTRRHRTYSEMLYYLTNNYNNYSVDIRSYKINRNSKVLMYKSYIFLITPTKILPLARLVINKENFFKYFITSLTTEKYLERLATGRVASDIASLVSDIGRSQVKGLAVINLEINKSIVYTKQYNLSKFRTALKKFIDEDQHSRIQEVENLDFINNQRQAKFQSIQHQKNYFEDFTKSFNNYVTFFDLLNTSCDSRSPLNHMLL